MDGRWLALGVLTFARISMGFQFQSLGSLAPLLMRDLRLDNAAIGSLIGLYVFPGLALALLGAVLARRFGDRRIVAFGLLLMVAGGVLPGLWPTGSGLFVGRLVSGVGGVLLNVVMTKMVTDWFAQGHLVVAMAVYANAYPVGIGLALLTLGPLAEAAGWPLALDATAALSLIAFVAMTVVYRPHPNDGRPQHAAASLRAIPPRDAALACLAGTMWGMSNAAFSILMGFAPILLRAHGLSTAQTGVLLGLPAWLLVVSVQAGGLLEDRWPRPTPLVVLGCLGPGLALLALPIVPPLVPVLLVGLTAGLPAGVMLALPAEVLHPQHRSLGMGLFYTCMYAGLAGLPAVAGWLQDKLDNPATAIDFGGVLFLAVLPLFLLFRLTQRGSPTP